MLGLLTLSENWGLGIPAAKDLNRGVTWRGELNSSEHDKAETMPSLFICSSQDGNKSAIEDRYLISDSDLLKC